MSVDVLEVIPYNFLTLEIEEIATMISQTMIAGREFFKMVGPTVPAHIIINMMDAAYTHHRLCLKDCNDGLATHEEIKRDQAEEILKSAIKLFPDVFKGGEFTYDPRGWTVGVKLTNGRTNSFAGSVWLVPPVQRTDENVLYFMLNRSN
jgi:hypothetical protein